MSAEKVILQPKQPQRFEGRNIRTPKRSGAKDDLYLVQFEISREAWEQLETVPKTALLEGVIWFHFGETAHDGEKQDNAAPNEQQGAKEKPSKKKAKGEYGPLWSYLFKNGFNNIPCVKVLLDTLEGKDAKDKLHNAFGVDSLTYIDNVTIKEWINENCSKDVDTGPALRMIQQAADKLLSVEEGRQK